MAGPIARCTVRTSFVLSRGLGFALNAKGYALFMRQLLRFKDKHRALEAPREQPTVAQIESGIFGLVRQHVRSDSSQPPTRL